MTITAERTPRGVEASANDPNTRAYRPSRSDAQGPPWPEHHVEAYDAYAELPARIRAVGNAGTLRAAYEVGSLVQEVQRRLGRGEATRRGVKHNASYRQLSRLPSMPLSPASLCRCVQIHELALAMPELMRFRHVGVGHVAEVLGLDLDEQRSLLLRAEAFHWSRPVLRRQRTVERRCTAQLVLRRGDHRTHRHDSA